VTRVHSAAVGACVVLAGPILLAGCGASGPTSGSTTTATHHVRPLPANAVRIHWKTRALVPAPRAGHICITTYKTGHFCATYALGQTPAVILKRKLRAKGWVVVETT
jgi:hypothetical protein